MLVEVSRFATLAEARAHAQRAIDEAAERARTKYITPGSGQAMEYQAALAEAQRRVANNGGGGQYRMLQADVDAGTIHPVTGLPVANLDEAADAVLIMYGAWEHVGSMIRAVRLGGKAQVAQATTQAQVAQIRDATIAGLAAF
jgi:hypothetical protein